MIDLTEEMVLNIKGCPTKEEVEYHKGKADEIFPLVMSRIEEFMTTGEEIIRLGENEFEDVWIFALIMGKCGKRYYKTNTTISYGRSNDVYDASIEVINNAVRYNRLSEELAKINEKMSRMDVTSSKYEKLSEKKEKLCKEIEKYKIITD